VAQQNYYFFSKVGRMKPDVDVDAIATLKTKDEIVPALAASFAYAHKAVGTLTVENGSGGRPPTGHARHDGSSWNCSRLQSPRPTRRVSPDERDRSTPGP
jgi:hypothetical protein